VTLLSFVAIREKKEMARRASKNNASDHERGEPLLKQAACPKAAAARIDPPRVARGPTPAEPKSPEKSGTQSKTALPKRLAGLQRDAQLPSTQNPARDSIQISARNSIRQIAAWTDVLRDKLPVLGRRSPMTKEKFKAKVIQHRGIAILKANISMCFSWSSFFATQWLVASFLKESRDFTVVEVVTAAIISHLVFVLIRILDICADNNVMGNLGERAVRRVITSLGLLIGFGWEKSFHASIEAVAAFSTIAPLPTNVAFAFFALIVIMPHWRRFIIPMVEEHGYRYGFVPRKVCNRVEYMIDHKKEGGMSRVHEYGQVLRKLASVKGGRYFKVLVTAEGQGHKDYPSGEFDEELFS
jgi:competence protein ComGC